MIHRLMTIQDKQLESWKESLMLEQRVLLKFLPKHFDQLEHFITSKLFYSPVVDDDDASVKYQLKHLKILQESKRIWLDIYLRAYMLKIQQYDRDYQHELVQLEQCLTHSIHRSSESAPFQSVQTYMNHRSHRLKQEIYLQMNYFHLKLTRRRHRHPRSCHTKQLIGVSPEVILDVHHRHHNLNAVECEYLSRRKMIQLRIVDFNKKFFINYV